MVDTSAGPSIIVPQQLLVALGNIAQAISTSSIPTVTVASTAGTATGTYLNITVGGTAYKIALLNP